MSVSSSPTAKKRVAAPPSHLYNFNHTTSSEQEYDLVLGHANGNTSKSATSPPPKRLSAIARSNGQKHNNSLTETMINI